jgi:hypothetical protein
MNRALTLLCAALLSLGACKDGGTPTIPKEKADLIVHLSAAPSAPTMQTGADGQTLVTCTFTIQALATGDLRARADWTGGWVRLFTSFDTQPIYSRSLEGSDLTEVFGGPFSPLLDGAALLTPPASEPYLLEMDVSYRVQNTDARRTASVRSSCGLPAPNPAIRAPALPAAPLPAMRLRR